MTVTTLDQDAYFRDWRMFQILAGDVGSRDARPVVNLGNFAYRTVYDVSGIYGIDLLSITTRVVDGITTITSARAYDDGVRLASIAGFAVRLDEVNARGLAALYAGDDLITGNRWANTLRGYAGNDTLRGGWGEDTLVGNAGRDWLNGLAGDDTLHGGAGADLLVGGNENDRLFGGIGVDRLSGGTGRDTMTGGDFKDTFVFRSGDGQDVITDFNARLDVIEIASGAEAFADLTIRDAGPDVIVTFDDVRIRLVGVDMAQVGVGDFLFT